MTWYQGKYRIESTRLPGWDYSQSAYYFVTICCKDRISFFGQVTNGIMQRSAIGAIVAEEWQHTEQIRPNVTLDEWIMMPNHLHGIIILRQDKTVETDRRPAFHLESEVETGRWPVFPVKPKKETGHRPVSTSQLKSQSLRAIIGQFKSVCTKRLWKQGFQNFGWQPRFYEHIIRTDEALYKAREYIRNNPVKWEVDKENPINLFM